jgi:hypothetical protein
MPPHYFPVQDNAIVLDLAPERANAGGINSSGIGGKQRK